MFQQAIDFVLKAVNGAVDILTDLNTVAPIIGIALVSFLILTVVSRLILPIIGGTLPSGMADKVDEFHDDYKKNKKYKKDRAQAYAKAQDLRTYDRRYMNRKDN